MKYQAKQVQYTIRGVPSEVDYVLRQRAAQRNQSLNQVILEELTLASGRRPSAQSRLLGLGWQVDSGSRIR
jgi:hypothetical protein